MQHMLWSVQCGDPHCYTFFIVIMLTIKCNQKNEGIDFLRNVKINFVFKIFDRVNGSLSPCYGASAGCGRWRLPPDMECSCEYAE